MTTIKDRPKRSKIIDESKWVHDLRDKSVMVNSEIAAIDVNFSDADVFAKTVQRFRQSGLQSAPTHASQG